MELLFSEGVVSSVSVPTRRWWCVALCDARLSCVEVMKLAA